MAHSSRTGSRKSTTGTVTVIETRVRRTTARNARVGGFLAGVFTGLLSAAVFTQWLQPVAAAFAGIAIGVLCGAVAWAAIRVWPFVRLVWWWSGELAVAVTVLYLWVWLCRAPLAVIVTVAALAAGSFAFARTRRVMAAVGWCFIVRHRLRTCFSQFIVSNQSGSLPLIFLAKPTPVGERVWIYLRPGLSVSDLQHRVEKIAVACHASAVAIDRASARTAGFLRVDIKRREVLGGLVGSPLIDDTDTVPTGIPVTDTDDAQVLFMRPRTVAEAPVSPAPMVQPYRPTPPATVKVPAGLSGPDEDMTDYI